MNILPPLAIALLVLVTLWWVLKPLWERPEPASEGSIESRHDLAELEARRDILYRAIKDLELDFEAGKIAEYDYQQVRLKFMRQAADVLKQIDQLSQRAEVGLDAEIDAMLAQFQAEKEDEADEARALRREARAEILRQAAASAEAPAEAAGGAAACPACGAPVAEDDAFCSQCGAALEKRCPACNTPAAPQDRFCTHCGARLAEEVAS